MSRLFILLPPYLVPYDLSLKVMMCDDAVIFMHGCPVFDEITVVIFIYGDPGNDS